MALFPGPENVIQTIEENPIREETTERFKSETGLIDLNNYLVGREQVVVEHAFVAWVILRLIDVVRCHVVMFMDACSG